MPSFPPDFPTYSKAARVADGIVHALGLAVALVATSWLVRHVGVSGHGQQFVAVVVYSLGLMSSLLASAAYNVAGTGRLKGVLRQVDHAMIFLMVAGTYTPFGLCVLPPDVGIPLCGTVWTLAVIGIFLNVATNGRSERVSFTLYFVMGWLFLAVARSLLAAASGTVVLLVLLGGGIYSFGSWIHARGRGAFQNVIWHSMVMIAAGLHWAAVAMVMV